MPVTGSRVLFCEFGDSKKERGNRDTSSRNISNSGCDEVFGGWESGEGPLTGRLNSSVVAFIHDT